MNAAATQWSMSSGETSGRAPSCTATKLASGSRGGTWSSDGWIYFSGGWAAPLSRVAATGGEVNP